MEDVLETYQRPRDPERPLVCLDETSKQLIAETRASIPVNPRSGQTLEKKSPPGSATETSITQWPIGTSQPKTPA